MTRYLIDTTTLIDYSKAHEPSASRIDAMFLSGDELGLCAVNIAEFMAGISPAERDYWWAILSAFTYWDISK